MTVESRNGGLPVPAAPGYLVADDDDEIIMRARVRGDAYDRLEMRADGGVVTGTGAAVPNTRFAELDPATGKLKASQSATVVAPVPTGVAVTDIANIQALLDAKGTVVLRKSLPGATNYDLGTTGLVVPAGAELVGPGPFACDLKYSGTGWAVTVGNAAKGGALAYGCRAEGFRVVISSSGGNGVRTLETAGAVRRNIIVTHTTVGASTGVAFFRDGGNTADILGIDDNCYGHHMKFPHKLGSTGTSFVTSLTGTGCNGFGDLIAGSVGLQVDAPCQGNRYFGGNMEKCAVGVSVSGHGNKADGLRFEANTLDVQFNAGAKVNTLDKCVDVRTVTDNSGNLTNSVRGHSNVSTGALFSLRDGRTVILADPLLKLALGPDGTLNAQSNVFQNVDLSTNVPEGAKAAVVSYASRDTVVGTGFSFSFRKGQTDGATTGGIGNQGEILRDASATFYLGGQVTIPLDSARKFQYRPVGASTTAGELYLTIVGYLI